MGESRFKPEAPLIGEDWRASVRCSNYNLARQSSREESRNRDNAKNAISVDDLGCSNSLPRSRTALSIELTWLRRLPSKESIPNRIFASRESILITFLLENNLSFPLLALLPKKKFRNAGFYFERAEGRR